MTIPIPFALRVLVMTMLITSSGCALFWAAEEEIIRLDEHHESHVAEKMNAMGIHWLETGDPDRAQRSFEKALIADETYGPAHNNLGQIYFDTGDMSQAALAFDTAARYMPGNPVSYNNLGLALESGGKLLESLEHYQRAHEIDPSNEEFLGNLVRARIRLGDWDESVVIQLRELRFIETRPDWIDWIDEQLAIRFNPFLDRGPGGPEFSVPEDSDQDGTLSNGEPSPTPDDALPRSEAGPHRPPLESPRLPALSPLQDHDSTSTPPEVGDAVNSDVGRTRISSSSEEWMPPMMSGGQFGTGQLRHSQ